MAISFKQILAPAQVDDVEAAQRRQAIAEAMQQRAMQPNLPQAGGPVQAKYGAGNALVDLANSLASAWNLKNANTALGRAKEARAGQVQDASKRVAMSQPNMPMATGPGEIMSPLTPEEASADLGRAMGPEGQTAVAKALMERKLSETDPAAALDRDVKLEQIRSGIADRKEARAQSMLALQMRIASDERQGKDTSDLKRQLAQMTIEQRQAEERGRTERADADRQARLDAQKAKDEAKDDQAAARANSFDSIVLTLKDKYRQLDENGGIVNSDKDWWENTKARASSSGVGQSVSGVIGTKNQYLRDSILQTRPLLLAAIKQATNLPAAMLNSNVELKTWLDASSSPERDYKASVDALDNLVKFVAANKREPGTPAGESAPGGRTVKRTGMANGRKVVEYSDGTIEYAD